MPWPWNLDEVKNMRKPAYNRMLAHSKAKRKSPALNAKRTKLAKLMEQVAKLSKEVLAACPHVVANQQYEEWGIENTLGCYRPGMECRIICNGCCNVLERWNTTDS